ncbi:MAG: glycerol-3-phosphate dehydrogenase [Deltaproteobacteria bacterium]|nr:glycerol-3-phosphate dehydrogenase [Deltaproteobacteria bacterium]
MGQREAHLSRLPAGRFDILVVGGGITGAGVARDAAHRGLQVALVEQGDLAYGTSSRSSKLIHGGLRYLEQGQFSLVFESLTERRVLMDIAPHLVQPLPFLFPSYRGEGRPAAVLDLGMWLYDGLSLFRSPHLHQRLKRGEVATREPALRQEGLTAAQLYYDCATDDARLTLETALDAAQAGAVIGTWTRLERFVHDDRRRVVGAVVRDRLGGASWSIEAGAVVNATGPWTDTTRALALGRVEKPLLRPTLGVHIVVDRSRLPVRQAVVLLHPRDERILFAIPWGERTVLGTTDTDWAGDPEQVQADAADVRYLLDAAAVFFPDARLQAQDVIATWAGLRPLVGDGSGAASQVSREHQVLVEADGLVTVAGGKLTTYRRMAAEVVDRAVDVLLLAGWRRERPRPAATDQMPLPGGVGWPEDDDRSRVARQAREASGGRLDDDTALLLADTYGMLSVDVAELACRRPELAERILPDRPEVRAQVEWAVTRELAARLEDVLARRLPLLLRDQDQGLGAAEPVARQMAALLAWDEARTSEEVTRYRAEVARSRAWREGWAQDPADG